MKLKLIFIVSIFVNILCDNASIRYNHQNYNSTTELIRQRLKGEKKKMGGRNKSQSSAFFFFFGLTQ